MRKVGDHVRYAGRTFVITHIKGATLDWRDGPTPAVAWIQNKLEVIRVNLDALD